MNRKPILLRMTTVAMSLRHLISGQMKNAKRNGFEVYMASANGQERQELEEIEGVNHNIIDFERDISLVKDFKALIKTYSFIRSIRPDIVHTHTPKAALLGMIVARLLRVPVRIHTVAGMPLVGLTGLKQKIVIFTEKLTYSMATDVWPNSYSLKNYIIEKKFTTSKKLLVIGQGSSNGIDLEDYSKESLKPAILEKVKTSINFQPSLKYMLFVGRIVSQKGIEELVDVFHTIKSEYPEWRLVLVGPFENDRDPVSEDCQKKIENTPEIITTGFSPYVKYFCSISNLFVFPSHREGFPNVPLQAGAMGCPVLASRITGNVDILTHNETGLLHKVKDANDLREKLLYALEHEVEMKKMAEALKKHIQANFDRKYVQSEIIKKYRELLAEKGIPAK